MASPAATAWGLTTVGFAVAARILIRQPATGTEPAA
jgi:hypothetical protein